MINSYHHISAIAGDIQKNIDFYTNILGLKMVKMTVNFDDPSTYHLYYGDEVGSPGTLITFFMWPNGEKGRQGIQQVNSISLKIPKSAIAYWVERFTQKNIKYTLPISRFGEKFISIKDFDGLNLELVGVEGIEDLKTYAKSDVPEEQAIRGIYGSTIWAESLEVTELIIKKLLGWEKVKNDKDDGTSDFIHRYRIGGDNPYFLEIRDTHDFWEGEGGLGTVHHIAFGVETDKHQEEVREMVKNEGLMPTYSVDRKYFHSVYFREPGKVLFEIATNGPGMTIDESAEKLGKKLQLPVPLEKIRKQIVDSLPTISF